MILRRRGRNGSATIVERRSAVEEEFSGSDEQLFAEIERLIEANRARRDREVEGRLMRLRHLAGIRILEEDRPPPRYPPPDFGRLPDAEGLPDIAPREVTPELVRAGILRDGSLLVRGLIPRDEALRLADEIDRCCEQRDRHDSGASPTSGYYEEFQPDARFAAPLSRPWIAEGGGLLAADSPTLTFDMFEGFERARILELARGYLGEPVAISAQKTTLRKADPAIAGAWHQDGTFMGEVRALNVWVSLSRCGDVAPGLDIVPRRLDYLVDAGTEGTFLTYEVAEANAAEAAGDVPIIRPIFEPGDALFFDELCLHQTASDPSMPNHRYAIESWFFGASAFPDDYAPIAV